MAAIALDPVSPLKMIVLPWGLTLVYALGTVTVALSKYIPVATGVHVNVGDDGAVPEFVTFALLLVVPAVAAIDSALVLSVDPYQRGSGARKVT